MRYLISAPASLNARILLPSSKSISNRALILKALSKSPYPIHHLSDCDDTDVMVEAFTSGNTDINVKAAGTAMRFLTAYLSQFEGDWTITGTERMKNRPIRILVDALRQLGAKIEYLEKEGFPPLKITGTKLSGGEIELDGSVSSQYISALMMIAPLMEKGLELKLQGEIISRPYIVLTIKMLQDFGIDVNWNDHHISIAPQAFTISDYCVESDWSAASYWYEIVALSGTGSKVELLGLYRDSFQGDAKVAGLFGNLGIRTEYTDKGVELYHDQQPVSFFEYDFVNEPDLAQTFVVTCCLKKIPFRFTGLQTLRIKETDRIYALQVEMRKLGFVVSDSQDSIMEWNGATCTAEGLPSIDTYEDHRMAMAFAPASLTQGKICINEPQVVSKSYPGYWKDLEQAGFSVG